MFRYSWLIGLALGLSLASPCAADLLIADYNPAVNDRFFSGPNPDFVAQGYDLSGVGKSGGQWANLVSDHFALSANHDYPGVGTTVTFAIGNGPNPTLVMAVVSGVDDVPNSDLELLRFDTAVDARVARFGVIENNEASLTNQSIFVYGTPNRVGTNNIDGFAFQTNIGGAKDTYAMYYDYNTKNGNPNEAYLETGDSGGPSFVVGKDNTLALAGIHSFNGTTDDGTPVSGDSFVGHYIPDIQSLMDSHGYGDKLTIVSVPEPASLSLIGVGLLALGVRTRRRRAASSL